jgi:5-hydroxyisourate hydrolase
MSDISTHVLDLARGTPARAIDVALERADSAGSFVRIGRAMTDADGRIASFGTDTAPGRYRLTFRVESYFAAQGTTCFFPEVQVMFEIRDASLRHHVPLLLSAYGYSTYRGS